MPGRHISVPIYGGQRGLGRRFVHRLLVQPEQTRADAGLVEATEEEKQTGVEEEPNSPERAAPQQVRPKVDEGEQERRQKRHEEPRFLMRSLGEHHQRTPDAHYEQQKHCSSPGDTVIA